MESAPSIEMQPTFLGVAAEMCVLLVGRCLGAMRFTIGALQQILLKRSHTARIAYLTTASAVAAAAAEAKSGDALTGVPSVEPNHSHREGKEYPSSSPEPLEGGVLAGRASSGESQTSGSLTSQAPSGPALPYLDALQTRKGGDIMSNLPEVRSWSVSVNLRSVSMYSTQGIAKFSVALNAVAYTTSEVLGLPRGLNLCTMNIPCAWRLLHASAS